MRRFRTQYNMILLILRENRKAFEYFYNSGFFEDGRCFQISSRPNFDDSAFGTDCNFEITLAMDNSIGFQVSTDFLEAARKVYDKGQATNWIRMYT